MCPIFYIFTVLLHWLGCGPRCLLPKLWQQPEDRYSASSPPPEQHHPVGHPHLQNPQCFPTASRWMEDGIGKGIDLCCREGIPSIPFPCHIPLWPGLTPPWNLGFPLYHNRNALLLSNWPALTFPRYTMPFLRSVPFPCPLARLEFPLPLPRVHQVPYPQPPLFCPNS